MPPEQSRSGNTRASRAGSAEKDQHPPIVGGVRGLLGLPLCETGLLTTAPLAAPPRAHQYGQPPWRESEESDESFPETVRDEELIQRRGYTDPQSDFSGSSLRDDGASFPIAITENPGDKHSAPSTTPMEHREHASFVIPGVSTQRTQFAALSRRSDTTKVIQPEESQEPSRDKIAHLDGPLSRPPRRQPALLDGEFLSQLEQLVSEGTNVRNGSELQRASLMAPSPSAVEHMGVPNREDSNTDVAQSLARLQRVVNELSATVSSHAAQMRNERQAGRREGKTTAERIVVQRVEASSRTPRAFWERSRLGRLHLRTGR